MERKIEYYYTRFLERFVNVFIAIVLLIAMLYSTYSLWDTWEVLHEPMKVKKELEPYNPSNKKTKQYGFKELLDQCPDVCAWIKIDGTKIDYPIVQGTSNQEYISKDVFGNYSAAGSLFLDETNQWDFTDPYCIIMGHHMQNGTMLGSVDSYWKQGFLEKHKKGKIYLPNRIFPIKIVAATDVDAYDPIIFQTEKISEEKRMEFLNHILETDYIGHPEQITCQDQIVILSTCSAEYTNARKILIAIVMIAEK